MVVDERVQTVGVVDLKLLECEIDGNFSFNFEASQLELVSEASCLINSLRRSGARRFMYGKYPVDDFIT